ncbi:hypothetical protein CH333_06360 [candidate division WOR-3 bacterium JGI_Cruoil_03_44_89]|uniref:Uncharacterized protein n=1 Tax=candidate division WOR-3 bacterium JGI_Cruoil_03_44_89 TaxID=1973748 RepID=A0A235BRN6_UNCW3|nr:MAG: hypothetical protein CH333_06360 [candidate division WOR-3 bacterium JGI_Cruoil_03_44_89]
MTFLAMTFLTMTSLAMTLLLTTTIIKKSWAIRVYPCLPVPTDPYGQAGVSNFFLDICIKVCYNINI